MPKLTIEGLENRIADVEGLREVAITDLSGRNLRGDKTRGLRRYRYTNAAPDQMTIADWKRSRFKRTYPEYDVRVFDQRRRRRTGNAKLSTLRRAK